MLDGFIIKRIRTELEQQRERAGLPLPAEPPRPVSPKRERPRVERERRDRGSTVVDYQI